MNAAREKRTVKSSLRELVEIADQLEALAITRERVLDRRRTLWRDLRKAGVTSPQIADASRVKPVTVRKLTA